MNDLAAKVAQLFVVPLSGVSLISSEHAIFGDIPFGGFVLFKQNCADPEQIVHLCESLWKVSAGVPPFIAIDQEGGRAHRLPPPFTHFPPAAQIASNHEPALAYRTAYASAVELALAGINVNFAPVLDVNSNPRNPVIGARSFGGEPRKVTEFGAAWIQGTRHGGIIPCGKHFPGHGDTDRDSHLDLPCVARELESIRSIELPPFLHACQSGIEALMTAHVVYPAFDREFPATLSRRIISGLLREEIGYDGVVFSDALEMKAISGHYGEEKAVVLALEAGVDVLLYCHDLARVVPVFDFVFRRAEADTVLRQRVEQSYARVLTLKRRYLKEFTGVPGRTLIRRLSELNHERIVEQIQASL